MKVSSKPSRKELLRVIGDCQNLFGQISAAYSDTNPNRAADMARLTQQGHDLCVTARSYDPPS